MYIKKEGKLPRGQLTSYKRYLKFVAGCFFKFTFYKYNEDCIFFFAD